MPDRNPEEKEEKEAEEIEERSSPGGHIVYQAVHKEGEDELARSNAALAWSGLAAGMAMGFSLLCQAMLASRLPDVPWRALIVNFGYSVGFLLVVLGRQQLFTENTLTVILPLLRNRDSRTFTNVVRLWSIVFAANLLGALAIGWIIGNSDAVTPEVRAAMDALARKSVEHSFSTLVLRGIFAGWLIAVMVWLMPFAEAARVWVIIIITYFVGLGEFAHIIAGSVDVFYLLSTGAKTVGDCLHFIVPVLLGNIIGGSTIVATIAHAQYVATGENEPG